MSASPRPEGLAEILRQLVALGGDRTTDDDCSAPDGGSHGRVNGRNEALSEKTESSQGRERILPVKPSA